MINIKMARIQLVRSTCLATIGFQESFKGHWRIHLSTKAIGYFIMYSIIKDEWKRRSNCMCHLLEHCDILDEKIHLEDRMCPLESHAVSKYHLH
jgi:hypothetical protein